MKMWITTTNEQKNTHKVIIFNKIDGSAVNSGMCAGHLKAVVAVRGDAGRGLVWA